MIIPVQCFTCGKIVDPTEIEKMVDKVLADNPKQLQQYRGGKTKLQGYFAGQKPGFLDKGRWHPYRPLREMMKEDIRIERIRHPYRPLREMMKEDIRIERIRHPYLLFHLLAQRLRYLSSISIKPHLHNVSSHCRPPLLRPQSLLIHPRLQDITYEIAIEDT